MGSEMQVSEKLCERFINLKDCIAILDSNFTRTTPDCCNEAMIQEFRDHIQNSNEEIQTGHFMLAQLCVTPLGLIHRHRRWNKSKICWEFWHAMTPRAKIEKRDHHFVRRRFSIYTTILQTDKPDLPSKSIFHIQKMKDEKLTDKQIHECCLELMDRMRGEIPVVDCREFNRKKLEQKKKRADDICKVVEEKSTPKPSAQGSPKRKSAKRSRSPLPTAAGDATVTPTTSKVCKIPPFEPNPPPVLTLSASSSLDHIQSEMTTDTMSDSETIVEEPHFFAKALVGDKSTKSVAFESRDFDDSVQRSTNFINTASAMATSMDRDWSKLMSGDGSMVQRYLENSVGLEQGAQKDVDKRGADKLSLKEARTRRGLKDALAQLKLSLIRENTCLDFAVFTALKLVDQIDQQLGMINSAEMLVQSGALKEGHPGTQDFLDQVERWKYATQEDESVAGRMSHLARTLMRIRPLTTPGSAGGTTDVSNEHDEMRRLTDLIRDYAAKFDPLESTSGSSSRD